MEEKEKYELKYVDNGFDLCEEFVPAVVDTTKNRYLEEYTEIVDELNQQDKRIKELEKEKQQLKHQLEKSEKLKESYRLQNEQHHLQLLQFYSRLGVEAFGADIHEKALETLMIMKEQLAEKEKEIESLKHFKVTIGTMETNQVDISSTTYIDQDKISFAVEKLEQVKETAECVLDNALKNSSLNESYYDRLLDEIDNQINELKEMK